jgi:DNA modification methylase
MLALPEYSLSTLDVIHQIDALALLKALPSNYVNCAVTSPPYWGLRNYGIDGQIGLEPTMHAFIDRMVVLFREVRRVLRDDGTLWLNLGDSYAGSGKGGNPEGSQWSGFVANKAREASAKTQANGVPNGLKPKDLCGIPWRVALALQDDGWYLRSDIIWAKPNPMPESVTDRPTKAHEYIFLLTKSVKYWYDSDAIREPCKQESSERAKRGVSDHHKNLHIPGQTQHSMHKARANGEGYAMPTTRNKRTVWHVNPKGYDQAHFATYPMALIDPCVKAGCPPQVCVACGAPWERVTSPATGGAIGQSWHDHSRDMETGNFKVASSKGYSPPKTIGWQPTCDCHADTRPGIVYDPFMGAGTTALVAIQNGRHYLGSELNPEYVAMARQRIAEFDPFQSVEQADGITQLSLFGGV